ncbi:MAG: electron transport complex subunit RsxC [Clostridia bacterium]|nr:electron transport complex subunit RsxC [Clostridia bacterium]
MKARKGKYFPFGAHVPGNKELSSGSMIEALPPQEFLTINVCQHIGAPAIPVVEVGDNVKKGQLIAKEGGFVSANVYSPISGEVVDISAKQNATGAMQTHITVKNDFLNEEVFLPNMVEITPSSIIERIRLAGIVGLGGAGFPTAVKLMPKDPVDTLIINGAECEPYLTCDHRLMIEKTDEIYKGIIYLKKALNVDKVIVAIEKNKPDAISLFERFDDLDVVILKKQYPMGSEKHLIYVCTGKKVGLGQLPASVGCVVQNIKTAIAVYNAIELNKPLYEGVLTVSGHGINTPKNLLVPYGASLKTIIEYCGGVVDDSVKYVAGGPMMGKAIINLDVYTKKTDSGLLALIKGEDDDNLPTNCINCGKCVSTCPMRLTPVLMEFYINAKDFKQAEKLGVMNCIECGSCAYNCPAKRALTQSFAYAKAKIKEINAKETAK